MQLRRVVVRSAFIVLATVNAAALSAQRMSGYSYDVVTTSRMSGAMMPPEATIDTTPQRARVTAIGNRARVEYEREFGSLLEMAPGDYMVTDGAKLRFVSPSKKTVTVMALDEVAAGMGDLLKDLPMAMTVSGVAVTVDSLGPGERMLGYPTERWRIAAAYTIKIDADGMSQSMTQRQETEFWFTRALPAMFNPGAPPMPVVDSTKATGPFGELMLKMTRAMRALPKAFAVREVVSIGMDTQGMAMTSSVTTEISNLKPAQVDASAFVVPADYKVLQFTDQMRQLMDSASTMRRRP